MPSWLKALTWIILLLLLILFLTLAPFFTLWCLALVAIVASAFCVSANDGSDSNHGNHPGDSNGSATAGGALASEGGADGASASAGGADGASATAGGASATADETPAAEEAPVAAYGDPAPSTALSSTSLPPSQIEYDVFLNFRGPDTRKGFMDHLYYRLLSSGIRAFRYDEELHVGADIQSHVREAIKGSRISMAIFSRDYASSKSCLNELVQMWECSKLNEHTVIPIFYDISPSVVRLQSEDFRHSFEMHEEAGVDSETIEKWKEALREIGALKGYSTNLYRGYEGQLLKEVVEDVVQKLKGLEKDASTPKDDQLSIFIDK